MSSKETKSEETKPTQSVDRVAATYAATEKSLADIETKASVARREIREQAEGYARVQEERHRASAQWDYEEEQRRRTVTDRQKEEDRDRDRRYIEREASLGAREKLFVETAAELFGPVGNPFDPKQAKDSLTKKLEAAEAKGKAIAEKAALADYTTKKAIDEANAAKNLALLQSDNERLKQDNAKLEAENKRLSDVNTDLAKRTGDLALGAFQAAGGLQKQATESLQAAAQSGQRVPGR
jgi:hypothetical protein